jgi:Icc-related predicted phosphoesterase
MIIDCISDLHGYYPKLEGGDLLIVAGDLTARDLETEHALFDYYCNEQNYKKIIVIGGNHDEVLQEQRIKYQFCEYLCDSGTEFEGLKIWGSPWTKTFPGINPHCKAFTCETEEELANKWALIPDDTDILITHSPSFGNYDWIKNYDGSIGPSVGSLSLWMKCLEIVPKLHVFGHIHEAYGNCQHNNGIRLVNASIVNENYEPVNKPIRVIL